MELDGAKSDLIPGPAPAAADHCCDHHNNDHDNDSGPTDDESFHRLTS
jgi:hypothetical protein